jgi:hypothetical protein
MLTFALTEPRYDAEIITLDKYIVNRFNEEITELFHPLSLAPMRSHKTGSYIDDIDGFSMGKGYGDRNCVFGKEHLIHDLARMVFLSTKELRLTLPELGEDIYTIRFASMTAEHQLNAGSKKFALDLYATLAPDSDLFDLLHGTLAIEIVIYEPVSYAKLSQLVSHNLAGVELIITIPGGFALDYLMGFNELSYEDATRSLSTLRGMATQVLDMKLLNLPVDVPFEK